MPSPSKTTDLAAELKSLHIERRPPRRATLGWVVRLGIGGALVTGAYLAWSWLAPLLLVHEVELTSVSLITPAQQQQLLVATGYVVPQRQANIAPRIGGRVAKLFVEDGTIVKQGDVIAVLEDADYKAQV